VSAGCGCGEPGCADPARENPPGRTDLAYRVGTWSSLRARMIRALPAVTVPPDAGPAGARPLAALTARSADDPTIALVDAFACTCDVLTFYTERILNEGYLPTATQPRSVTELAAAIGYRPAPGLAATAQLAFTVEPSHPDPVTVAAGHAVQSIPAAAGELPVTFETSGELVARAEWNLLAAKGTRPHPIESGSTLLYLAGTDTRLVPSAPIVVVGSERRGAATGAADVTERWDLRWVADVAPDAVNARTVVTLDRGLGDPRTAPAGSDVEILTFDGRGGLFGWNAPDVRMMSDAVLGNTELVRNRTQWARFQLSEDSTRVEIGPRNLDLDREYPAVVTGGWICLQGAGQVELYRVSATTPASRTEFSLTARVTRVVVDSAEHVDYFRRRGTTVLLGSRSLAVAQEPDPTPVTGTEIVLAGPLASPLPVGRAVLVAGTDAETGDPVVVTTTVTGCSGGPEPVVTVADPIPPLVRAGVVLHANVVAATHGATVADEVLGSADAGVAGQRFRLARAPLTWLPAAPAGAVPALDVRVNGLLWQRVDTLYAAGPTDRVYMLDADPDAVTAAAFGDGVRGARPPSGVENVRAGYRVGIGLGGLVKPGQLGLLQSRPPGLVAVTNPAGAAGAADPDSPDDVRRLAPRTVLTMDRLVSLQDYEDFAASFAGIGKAAAARLWDGRRGFVHLTVATSDGRSPQTGDPAVAALEAAIELRADPAHHYLVRAHQEVSFGVTLGVLPDPAYLLADVLAAVRAALSGAFSFSARAFGQPVAASEVVAVGQAVPGVVAVDLDRLAAPDGRPLVRGVLPAAVPRWDGTTATPAELLTLGTDPADCVLFALGVT
jgi:predicted phage baseplate assembly protein